MDEDTPKPVDQASAVTTPVAPASFYSAQTPQTSSPALRKRKSTAGSSHTTYVPPALPSYSSTWREPELVAEDETAQPLAPTRLATASWGDTAPSADWNQTEADWSGGAFAGDNWVDSFGKIGAPPIDGRNEAEEKSWWDPASRSDVRPGRGMLPPLLADKLHHADHSLFMVSVTPPDPKLTGSSPPSPPGGSSVSSPSSTSPPPSSSPTATVAVTPPTAQEVLEAIPHPNAYYCRRHNGWVLLAWKSSSILPPLTASFLKSNRTPLPDQDRRKRTHSCLGDQPFGPANKSHHFHQYKQAVDARHLNPGFLRRGWEGANQAKKSRRKMTLNSDELSGLGTTVLLAEEGEVKMPLETATDEDTATTARDLLDLYVCCQCSFYVVVSDVIAGVIPPKYVEEITSDRVRNPSVSKTGEQSAVIAWETILTIIENKIWKGINKGLSISGKGFHTRVGWSMATQKIFESLGFSLSPGLSPEQGQILLPPSTDLDTDEGKGNREKLLRAWVEISAYLVDYQRRFPSLLKGYTPHRLWVKAESARESYQTATGAHPDQIPRGSLPSLIQSSIQLDEAWEALGMTPTSYDRELLHFAYLAQCRCDPDHTVDYYTHLGDIATALRQVGECPQELDDALVEEQSRGRFTLGDVAVAARTLGFGADNALRVDFEDDVPEEFIARAWRDGVRRAWHALNGARARRDLNDAFRIVAEARGSRTLWNMWNEEQANGMSPDKAYSTLEVPQGVDEEMLITIYGMRVEDQPSQLDKMKSALKVIAEFTGSDRLRKFLETGSDPGVVIAPTRPDWPRGLNQLGNTCYLNSLLQYFYTIKDLREAIALLVTATEKFVDDDKLKDDDLKNHRVGGRVVTRREVIRSRKFVSQLANLFWLLEWCEEPAVTPSLELAKLALVTSKDEEDDGDRGGTDSSHSTDATLVEESLSHPSEPAKSASPPAMSPSSVLGKRSRGLGGGQVGGDADADGDRPAGGAEEADRERDKDGYVLVSNPASPAQVASPVERAATGAGDERDVDGDVQMADAEPAAASQQAKAPPLPPRRKHTSSTSDMMFGKQHDVAECMDNCMFQMETALLQLGELADSDDNNKRSVVKRLFYGKIRQRLSVQTETGKSKSSIHEREDYFSHLPVNVSEESFDLHDGLSGYFDDVVEFEGKMGRMKVDIVELPPILQIQLQRVQFNRETLQPYKSHAYVKFGETISMDRFLHDAPADKKAQAAAIQAELTACRDRIHALTQGNHAPYTDTLRNSWHFLINQDVMALPEVDGALLSELERECGQVGEEIGACRARAGALKEQLEAVWGGEHRAEYELTSVFVHRGASPSFGHYFIYQRWLPDHPDAWFKYNDSNVTVVTKEEVLADTTGSTANPYLLVFARKGAEVIKTVQRVDHMKMELQ